MQLIRNYIEREGLKAKNRKRVNTYKRYYIFNYLKETYKMNLTQIGEEFNRDHATIIHGLKNYEIFKDDDYFKSIVRDLEIEFEVGVLPTQNLSTCVMFEILKEQDIYLHLKKQK